MCQLNFLKVDIEFGVILLNQTHTGPFKVVGNSRHIILSRMPWRCKRVLKNSRWSSESFVPSQVSKDGIWKLGGRRQDVTRAMKGESIQCTKPSSMAIHPFIVFIIRSILSISFSSASHRVLPVLGLRGGASSLPVCLLAALLSALSSSWRPSLKWW